MECKRIALIIPIACIILFIFEKSVRQMWYSIPLALISSFIIFSNIPKLVTIIHEKPTYVEDLEDDEALSEIEKYELQGYFTFVNTVLFSITACIVTEYIFKNLKNAEQEWQKTAALIGGSISFYGKISSFIGKFSLFVFMKIKNKKQTKRRTSVLELTNNVLPSSIHKSDDINNNSIIEANV